MIIDDLGNIGQYSSLHPLFIQAFDYLRNNNLNSLEVGKFQIADGLNAIVSEQSGKTSELALEKFECHNNHIDIQCCIFGTETIGWKPRAKCNTPNGNYNEEKDVRFFPDKPDMYFQLSDFQFVILYPNDVHAPMIGNGIIKKIVIKVKI